MRPQRIGPRGFTLIEAMMAVAIVGIVSAVAGSILVQAIRFYRQTTARSEIQRNARVALDLMQRGISEAKGRTITVDRLNDSQPFYSRITFTSVEGHIISFYQEGTKLKHTVLSGGTTKQAQLADNLRLMTISYPQSDNAQLLSLGLAFEKATYEGGAKSLQMSLEKVRIQNPNDL